MIEDNFLPQGFKAKIRSEIGEKRAEILFSALSGEPETSIRVNRHKPTPTPLYPDMTPIEWCASGSYLAERPAFTSNPLLHAGVFYVQDASSMIYETIVEKIIERRVESGEWRAESGEWRAESGEWRAEDREWRAESGEWRAEDGEWRAESGERKGGRMTVCDLCAAPGGKTTAILNALPEGSTMLANEFTPSRANILKENLCKYGYPDIIVTNADTSRLAKMKGAFDLVAIDAPCSGEGMMRKDETARSQWSEGLIRQCATLQREIIENGIEMLAPGGYLIYSTCTFNTSEDEDNAGWIAETFGLEPVNTGLAGKYGIQGEAKGDIPCLRFMPGFTRGEGLFVAVFRKPSAHMGETIHTKGKKKGNKGTEKIDKRIMESAASWISEELEIINHDGRLLALSPATASLLNIVPKGIRILSAGVEVGEIKGKDLIPSHSLAMSTAMRHPFPEVELSREDALRYLAKEAILLPADTPRGYITAIYQGYPLGFLKNLGNRANNLYPSEYRIRLMRL